MKINFNSNMYTFFNYKIFKNFLNLKYIYKFQIVLLRYIFET